MHIKHTISPFISSTAGGISFSGKLDEVVSEMVTSKSISADGEAMDLAWF
jgi:hypothetical protein